MRGRKRHHEAGQRIDMSQVKTSDPEPIAQVMYRVQADGFVPKDDLHADFGDEVATRAIAILYRQYRVFIEVEKPWKGKPTKGYQWGDRRFSKTEMKRIPPELGFIAEASTKAVRYTDFQEIHVRCKWTNKILGGKPSSDEGGDINVFETMVVNGQEIILIPAYCPRAMAQRCLPMIGKSMSVAQHIRFSAVRVDIVTKDVTVQRDGESVVEKQRWIRSNGREWPMYVERHGNVNQMGQGLGIKRSEGFGPDVEFTLSAIVPTSELPIADYLRMLTMAGRYVRLSPARSSGYGDFEVVEVLEAGSTQ